MRLASTGHVAHLGIVSLLIATTGAGASVGIALRQSHGGAGFGLAIIASVGLLVGWSNAASP